MGGERLYSKGRPFQKRGIALLVPANCGIIIIGPQGEKRVFQRKLLTKHHSKSPGTGKRVLFTKGEGKKIMGREVHSDDCPLYVSIGEKKTLKLLLEDDSSRGKVGVLRLGRGGIRGFEDGIS